MTTYILLRSNKESGPFSLDQLREMGLKPNDLIWVEGQSASWRNPHEIRDLKELVSRESQKKQDPVKTSETSQSVVADEVPANPGTIGLKTEKKSVFVAMPDKQPVYKEPVPEINPVVNPSRAATASNSAYQAPTHEKPEEEVETKYAMSLDEIKQRYIRSLEDRKKKSRSLNFQMTPGIMRAAMYFGLVGLGALIVLLVMRTTPAVSAASEHKRIPGNFETRPPGDSIENSAVSVDQDAVLPESYYDSRSSLASEGKHTVPVKKSTRPVQSPVQNEEDYSSIDPDEEEISSNDDRISIPKNESPEIKTLSTSDIADQVSVKTNSYTIAALGGIRNLELTLRNDSRYILDKVIVEVRFLNPNGNIVKTEDIHFKTIKPSGTQTIGMKKTSRGVKVSYKIIRIESKEIGTHTAGI